MKTVIITGGSQGIGATLVRQFLKSDFKVIFSARKDFNEFSELGPNARFIKTDATIRSSHVNLVKTAMEWTGRLDVYINNVGLSVWRPLSEIDEAFLENMLRTNLTSAFWGCQAAAAVMKPNSCILNISSLAGKRGSANNSAYCAAKFGVNGLTQSLAKELGGKGIRVNAICPVYIKTENLLDALKDPDSPSAGENLDTYFKNFSQSQSALKRLPLASEIAQTCLYLASDGASAITGQCINVDCGVLPQ